MSKKILKEPLVHFLSAGFLLFVLYGLFVDESQQGESTIHVTKDELMNLMQFRSKAFQDDVFEDRFNALSEIEKKQLIDSYIREEVLYQEALKYGLENNDYIIKNRLIQKMDFIYSNQIDDSLEPSMDSLKNYFNRHKTRYASSEKFTFTHVFFKVKTDTDTLPAKKKVEDFLETSKAQQIPFEASLQYGNAFLYHKNYVDRDLSFIESHFGQNFSHRLSTFNVSEQWQGSIRSEHGFHAVLLKKKQVAEVPDFEVVKAKVVEDYKRAYFQEMKNEVIDEVVGGYEVVIEVE